MIYVIVDTKELNRTFLVRAEGTDEVKERFNFKDEERIVGAFTDNEIEALESSLFTIVSSFGKPG